MSTSSSSNLKSALEELNALSSLPTKTKNLSSSPKSVEGLSVDKTNESQKVNKKNVLRPPQIKLTQEQEKIVLSKKNHIQIIALAGTGKTETLRQFVLARPYQKFRYLVFNRSLRDDVKKLMPKEVKVSTIHEMAFPKYGKMLSHKLVEHDNEILSSIEKTLNLHGSISYKKWLSFLILNALKEFCFSASNQLTLNHFRASDKKIFLNHPETLWDLNELVNVTQNIWEYMLNPTHPLLIFHDVYVKKMTLAQYQCPYPLLLDESQDANASILNWISKQQQKWCLVGDPYQSIYQFRGAQGLFYKQNPSQMFSLTGSFRFGCNIADIANQVLGQLGSQFKLKGLSSCAGKINSFDMAFPQIEKEGLTACLCQTNFSAIEWGVLLSEKGYAVSWLGSLKENIDFLLKLNAWKAGQRGSPKGVPWSRFEDFCKFVENNPDHYWSQMFFCLSRIEKKYKKSFETCVKKVSSSSSSIKMGTVHQSKGLAFEHVVLHPEVFESMCFNFKTMKFDDSNKMEINEEDLRLLYVALTRSKKSLTFCFQS